MQHDHISRRVINKCLNVTTAKLTSLNYASRKTQKRKPRN